MCFSPTADFAAASVLAPIGILTLASARTRNEIPLASVPMIFALHQFVEGFVWLGTEGHVSHGVESFAIYLYLAMAQLLLPIFVPIAIGLIEPVKWRRNLMYAAAVLGGAAALRFALILIDQGAIAYPAAHTMVYKTPTDMGVIGGIAYFTATILTTLISSAKHLRWFGVANIIGVCLAGAIRYEAVTSVWCVYAAFVSIIILFHLRLPQGPNVPGQRGGRQRLEPKFLRDSGDEPGRVTQPA
jgi:hypothetical protein